MDWPAGPGALTEACARTVRTVVFVDIDGVLNVGARDAQGVTPLLYNDTNLKCSRRLWAYRKDRADRECIEKLIALHDRQLGHGEDATYDKFLCRAPSHLSEVLLGRLAQLIRAAGPSDSVAVVLASSWRRPQHAQRVRGLEGAVSRHLGTHFHFSGRTDLREECSAEERLNCIGAFLQNLYWWRRAHQVAAPLRALVLEDFFVTPMDGWKCGGLRIDAPGLADSYLMSCGGAGQPGGLCAARVIHTYEEFISEGALRVQVGTGLTMKHLSEALEFLGTPFASKAARMAEMPPRLPAMDCDPTEAQAEPARPNSGAAGKAKVTPPTSPRGGRFVQGADKLFRMTRYKAPTGLVKKTAEEHRLLRSALRRLECLWGLPWLVGALPWNPKGLQPCR